MTDTRESEEAVIDSVLHFPDGIPGFPEDRRFVLVELVEDGAFQELRSLDSADVSMLVCVPWLFFPDYSPVLSDAEQEHLGISEPEDAVVFCPVTFEGATRTIYVNLVGPFVVNASTHLGQQLVLADAGYSVRTPVDLPAS